MYLIGSDVYTCINRNNSQGEQGTPYEPTKSGDVTYTFKREQEYKIDAVDDKWIRVDDPVDVHSEKHIPIQKVAIGSVGTTRQVDYVEIGFKSRVYRQVNGYPNVAQFTNVELADDFAKEQQSMDLGTMNTYYDRISLFRMEIRKDGQEWRKTTGDELFAVHGRTAQDQYNQILIKLPEKNFYEFRFVPYCGNAWFTDNNFREKPIYLLNARKPYLKVGDEDGYDVYIKGDKIKVFDRYLMSNEIYATGEKTLPNLNPNNLMQDFWYYDTDTSSHADSPEHSITWLNEYVENNSTWYAHEDRQYEHLSHAGLICRSSKEVSTFSNFSAYITEGIEVQRFINSSSFPNGPTNIFPEVAFDLLTNRRYGVGEYVGRSSVDEDRFNIAAEFCQANGFHWDGVISAQTNVRNFLFEQAAYQLLDFTILGGQFSLYPAVPYDSNKTISFAAKAVMPTSRLRLCSPTATSETRTTFLSPEERQLFTAEVKWRLEKENDFPETHVTRVRLADDQGGYYRDPVEAFDCSQFMTSRDHAIAFAKYALRVRQTVDHSVSFETTPDAAHLLAPGDYIRMGVSIQHQERNRGFDVRLRTGSVDPYGVVQINPGISMESSDIDVFYWKPGMDNVREGRINVRDGKTQQAAFFGSLFTRKRAGSEARIYKIESIAYTEESFVEISGSYVPLTDDNRMQLLQWDDSDFVIEDNQS